MFRKNFLKKGSIFWLIVFFLCSPLSTQADRVADLQAQIASQTNDIAKLEAEIKQYQNQVNATASQTNTLQGALKQLEATNKKLDADIALTTKKISATNLQIEALAIGIQDSAKGISNNKDSLRETLREVNNKEAVSSPLTTLLEWKNLSDFWGDVASLSSLSTKINIQVSNLKQTKKDQETKKSQTEEAKKSLEALKVKLADQKKIAEANRTTTNTLLAETKNKEANYRALLADRLAKKQQVEAEIRATEDAIKITINPSLLPSTGTGVLHWPLDKVIITQYFGDTPFATANAQIYKGKGHNGIDLGTPIGTPVRAALSGKVIGAGDTDLVCKGASYGRWVMIVHDNGLATIYAHLSLIKVTEGQTVTTGDVIAYSGATGYVTGPHLHFSVLASQGVSVGAVKSKVSGCGTYRVPLSPLSAYLNPLSYL